MSDDERVRRQTMREKLEVHNRNELITMIINARITLIDGLIYHEHDGHNMPKRVARDALIQLKVPESEQP